MQIWYIREFARNASVNCVLPPPPALAVLCSSQLCAPLGPVDEGPGAGPHSFLGKLLSAWTGGVLSGPPGRKGAEGQVGTRLSGQEGAAL